MARNPFSPSWGVDPPVFVGRDEVLRAVEEALTDGPGSPDRAMLVTGVRGVGKTVFLRQAAAVAEQHGWLCVDIDTNPLMLEHFLGKLADRASRYGNVDRKALTSIGIAGFSIGMESTEPMPVSWDVRMERAIDLLREAGVGLLLTIDEVTPASPEFDTLAQAWKRIRGRRDNDAMIIMAGVPEAVGRLVNPPPGSVTSFLDKSRQHTLDLLTAEQARDALLIPIRDTGKTIDLDALDLAVSVSRGHPYTLQLLGWTMWKQALDGVITIDHAHAASGQIAEVTTSFDLIMRDRTRAEREYLHAVALDDGPTPTRAVAARLGRAPSDVNFARRRLLDAGLLTSPSRGQIDIAVPGLRDHLRRTSVDPGALIGPPLQM